MQPTHTNNPHKCAIPLVCRLYLFQKILRQMRDDLESYADLARYAWCVSVCCVCMCVRLQVWCSWIIVGVSVYVHEQACIGWRKCKVMRGQVLESKHHGGTLISTKRSLLMVDLLMRACLGKCGAVTFTTSPPNVLTKTTASLTAQ